MAERRMLSRAIMEEDALISLPAKVVAYYVYIILQADDDGLVDRGKLIRRMLGVREKDARLLVERGYLIPFDSGIMAVAHWHIHNRVRKDTYVPTKYTREMAMLETDKSGIYRLRNGSVTGSSHESVAGKDSGDEESRGQGKERKEDVLRQAEEMGISVSFFPSVEAWFAHKASRGEEQSPATVHSTLVQIKRNLDQYGEDAVGELIRLSIRNGWRGIFFDRLGTAKPATAEYGTPEDLYT